MINLIKFNKEYYKPIINGEKTQTIRKNNKRISTLEIVKAIFPGTNLEVKLRITDTGYKQFKFLNEEDAQREGFNNLKELQDELLKIYPRLDKFDRIYWYRFEVVDEDE